MDQNIRRRNPELTYEELDELEQNMGSEAYDRRIDQELENHGPQSTAQDQAATV